MRPPPYRVLILPGGTEIGLEVQRGLAHLKEVEMWGAGSESDAHGPFAYRRLRVVLDVGRPGWLDALRAVVAEERIDFVFPGHDIVLTALAERADLLGRLTLPDVQPRLLAVGGVPHGREEHPPARASSDVRTMAGEICIPPTKGRPWMESPP